MGETYCKMTQSVQQRRMRRFIDVYSGCTKAALRALEIIS